MDNQLQFKTPLEKYNHYSQCLSNNSECPASDSWRAGRDNALKQIQHEQERFSKLEQRVTELEQRLG